MSVITNPNKIEKRSFEIIEEYLKSVKLSRFQKDVIKRVVHATADFSYIKALKFHPDAIKSGVTAIKTGKNIITDASMVKAGINKNIASKFKMKVLCFINDKSIIRMSEQLNITRAILSMRKASKLMNGSIVSIGNAPTALFELCDLIEKKEVMPALVIGVPVGFVGAKESKKKLITLNIPYITNISRKGGSNIAASIVNALLKIAEG